MKISVDIDTRSPELAELYEETNDILTASGRNPMDFEAFCALCLELGALPHMISTARALVRNGRKVGVD